VSCLAQGRIVIEHETEFRGREVTIEQEAGFPAEPVELHLSGQSLADRQSALVLPDDGRGERLAAGCIPQQEGFALIVEAGRCNRIGFDKRDNGFPHGLEDVPRVLLDPTRLRKAHGEPGRSAGDDIPPVVQNDRRGLGRALINSKQVGHPRPS